MAYYTLYHFVRMIALNVCRKKVWQVAFQSDTDGFDLDPGTGVQERRIFYLVGFVISTFQK